MANSVQKLTCPNLLSRYVQLQLSPRRHTIQRLRLHVSTSTNIHLPDRTTGTVWLQNGVPQNLKVPCRTLFRIPKLPNPLQILNKQKEFAERKIVGYSIEQMFDIVSEVEQYQEFVPWCQKSFVKYRTQNHIAANLTIGFPPINESFTSQITLVHPQYVRAECKDGKIFNYMVTTWKFEPGLLGNDKTCTIDFHISFEFRSALHSRLSTIFFDEVVRTMVNAFLQRAQLCYGKESIKTISVL